jgi:hypothetical protein
MHWAADNAYHTLACWTRDQPEEGAMSERLEWLFMSCFAAGAVWRDQHVDDPMLLWCPRDDDGDSHP